MKHNEAQIAEHIFDKAKRYYIDRFPGKASHINNIRFLPGHSAPFNERGQEWPGCPKEIIDDISLLSRIEIGSYGEEKTYVMGRIQKDILLFHPLLPGYDVDITWNGMRVLTGYPSSWRFNSRISLYRQIFLHEIGHIALMDEPLGCQPAKAEEIINSWILDEFMPESKGRNIILFDISGIWPRAVP